MSDVSRSHIKDSFSGKSADQLATEHLDEDLIVTAVLVGAVVVGSLVVHLRKPLLKQLACLLLGVSITLYSVGFYQSLHSLSVTLGNYVVIKIFGTRRCHWPSFAFAFGYVFYVRVASFLGYIRFSPLANHIQLLVTLKVVSIAFDIKNSHLSAEEKANRNTRRSHSEAAKEAIDIATVRPIEASLFDQLSYVYCYCGLYAGPFFRFTTFRYMLENHWSGRGSLQRAIWHLRYLPLVAPVYLIAHHYFPMQFFLTSEISDCSLPYRFLYAAMSFLWFRWRFYCAWYLAEAGCITLGLGAFPEGSHARSGQGPTHEFSPDLGDADAFDLSFETTKNIDFMVIETSSSVRSAIRNWNLGVQWWLSNYIHRDFPLRSFRIPFTFIVSAFWHGVYPGYYISFLWAPFMFLLEARMDAVILPRLSSSAHRFLYRLFTWFLTYRMFEYHGLGFLLLELDKVFTTFGYFYYIGHMVFLGLCLLFWVLPKPRVVKE